MDEVSAANFVAGRGIEGVLDGRNRLVVPWSAGNLSSALRLFVLNHYQARAA
jgi:hypothetical protein